MTHLPYVLSCYGLGVLVTAGLGLSAARRLAAMKREHAWWMEGADDLAPGQADRHVVRLADGSLLNRYWDPRTTPRDESWREDVETAADSGRPPEEVYRELRAGAESGWDFSSRWLDGRDLASIRTTQFAPIDLNSFLYGLERAIAAAGDADAPAYAERAAARREAMTGANGLGQASRISRRRRGRQLHACR